MTLVLSPHQSARAAALKPGETMMLIQRVDLPDGFAPTVAHPNGSTNEWVFWTEGPDAECHRAKEPHGAPGTVLGVKEAWRDRWPDATSSEPMMDASLAEWQPAETMPDWAIRHRLRVTGTRVCRAQEVTTDEARAYGIPEYGHEWPGLPRTDATMDMWRNRTSAENLAFVLDVAPHAWLWITTAVKV